jgi:BirA family biotin operon repressor/biotin-[acetyl-CoA-carboxylase] ligase
VVGIGINVLPLHGSGSGSGSDEGFRSGYACLQELGEPSAPQALLRIAPLLLRALLRFQAEGLAPLLATWARRDVLAGRRVTAGERQGVAEGIDAGGELLLRDDAGTLHRIASGEVSVRPC